MPPRMNPAAASVGMLISPRASRAIAEASRMIRAALHLGGSRGIAKRPVASPSQNSEVSIAAVVVGRPIVCRYAVSQVLKPVSSTG